MKRFFSVIALSLAVAFAGIGPIAYAETQDQTQQAPANQPKKAHKEKRHKENKPKKAKKHSRKKQGQ